MDNKIDLQPAGLDNIPVNKVEVPETLTPVPVPGENKKGIEQLKDTLAFLLALAVAIKKSLADDGKITITDAFKFYGPVTALPAFITGIGEVPGELVDLLTDGELAQIKAMIIESGVLTGDIELVAIEALDLLNHLKDFIYRNFVRPF